MWRWCMLGGDEKMKAFKGDFSTGGMKKWEYYEGGSNYTSFQAQRLGFGITRYVVLAPHRGSQGSPNRDGLSRHQ